MPSTAEDHTRQFFTDHDGLTNHYATGHWFKIECKEVPECPERPAGLKYSLAFFGPDDRCLVRFDNSHPIKLWGRPNPVAHDHWHRFTNSEELVPYDFKNVETLLSDFFEAIDRHLPPELRSA
jgi:hypothetical protein